MCEPKSLNAGEIENTLQLQLLLVNEISKKQKYFFAKWSSRCRNIISFCCFLVVKYAKDNLTVRGRTALLLELSPQRKRLKNMRLKLLGLLK
jgi:hypothetical protein